MKFTDKDLKQIESKGIVPETVLKQLEVFKKGAPFMQLQRAATLGDGILNFEEKKEEFIKVFETKKDHLNMVKFVPASGAATRMFKVLYQFLEEYDYHQESFNSYMNRKKKHELSVFFVGLEKFPFYKDVLEKTKLNYPDFDLFSDSKQKYILVETLLTPKGLNYGSYPKGLFPFHQYKDHNATAFEEHLFEAALYAKSGTTAQLHFTISKEHLLEFQEEFDRIQAIVEKKTNTKFIISFSYQKEATDTIAADLQSYPFRDETGELLFRPGGHGALIENLNTIDSDIIFIKNIDNVVVFKYEEQVATYKKLLAGILITLQEKIFEFLNDLDHEDVSSSKMVEIEHFIKNDLGAYISSEYVKFSKNFKIKELQDILSRPLRVCGMVKNEGEPGGGPFWVKQPNGKITLQIVESAQINKKDKYQKKILKKATHFNPVDLVCGVKNHKGEKYDLKDFIDHNAVFISQKTKNGKELQALELPGLWNGAMAYWNTIFVEVPLITFNPVKTVNDLLKSAHQIT